MRSPRPTALGWRPGVHDLPQCDDLTPSDGVVDRGIRDSIGKVPTSKIGNDAILDVRLLLRCVAIEYFTHSMQQLLLGERLRDEVGLRSQRLTTFTQVRVARHV
jgi:hypothetical protein